MRRNSLRLKKAIFVMSFDTELAWGLWSYDKVSRIYGDWYGARENFKRILSALERYEIPATWAFVGGLLEKNKKKLCNFVNSESNWHETKNKLLWSGDDVFELVLNSKLNHEIACHSYSHVEFNNIDIKRAKLEFDMFKRLPQLQFSEITTFIFPNDKVGHLDVVYDAGFNIIRKPLEHKNFNRIRKVLGCLFFFVPYKGDEVSYNTFRLWEIPRLHTFFPLASNTTSKLKRIAL